VSISVRSWGHLKVCAPNNANSDKPGTQNSNGLIAFAELGSGIENDDDSEPGRAASMGKCSLQWQLQEHTSSSGAA
jgi:hypothetical protein